MGKISKVFGDPGSSITSADLRPNFWSSYISLALRLVNFIENFFNVFFETCEILRGMVARRH